MPESGNEDERMEVLRAYATGVMSRSVAMQRLGLDWYGQLVDAMTAAGLRVHVPAEADLRMSASMRELFRDSPPVGVRRRPAAAAATLTATSSVVLRRCRRAVRPASAAPRRGIQFGLLRGRLMIPEDFDAPLPSDVLSTFTTAAITPENLQSPLLDDDSPRGHETW